MIKMFSWNIAKSAEAVFSRWAVKRVCKFLLKKKLGKLLLGDIDVEQLDVQLTDGTIQLSDLALNVDYLNEKFGASLLIKEGSIGSLLVKMPWKSKGCQVEVDELEIILAPRLDCNTSTVNEASTSNQEAYHGMNSEFGKIGNNLMENAAKSASIDVHEGVKTVAKIVKWFLTSFHVKIKKLIIAFEPYLDKEKNEVGPCTSLVFRMSEIECGTCVSEDPVSNNDPRADNFLGISRLTNFVKFKGAVLELLRIEDDDDDNESRKFRTSNAVTPIMTGRGGGFSGTLNLSIPWKHGSLDIHTVDADLCIDPVELQFQPATIKWLIRSWEHCKSSDSYPCSSISQFDSPAPVSATMPTDKIITMNGLLSSASDNESANETALPGLQFIPDWVPSSFSSKDNIGEVDFGASMDQFFECFDGMRSYQSALGSSGMWNWTSSVFTAITAASSLASGSLHLPFEQQHVQTSFKVSCAGISAVLFLQDEDTQKDDFGGVHYLGAECRDIFVSVQVCPRDMRLEGQVNNIEIALYFRDRSNSGTPYIKNQTSMIKNLQAEVLSGLPRFASSDLNDYFDKLSEIIANGFLSRNKDFAVKIVLVRAPGASPFQFTVNSQSCNGSFIGKKSFSLSLPPIIFWLNCQSIKLLVNLLDEVSESVASESYTDNDVGSSPPVTTLSSTENLQVNISIPTARAILCFPFESDRENLCSSLGEQFLVLDFSSPATSNKGRFVDKNPGEICSASAVRSICFSLGDVSIYLVASDHKGVETNSSDMRVKFSANKILHTSKSSCYQLSTIRMLWNNGPMSGPWLLERAKLLATLEESIETNKFVGKGHEFAAVTTVKNVEDLISQTREEITLGSTFCLHVHLLPVAIHLDSLQYSNLHHLLDQIKSLMSCIASETNGSEKSAVSQTSVIVECDSVEILVKPEAKEDVKSSLQSELPGSWHQLKLRIQKFHLLSASNIGGIHGADLFWLAHGEGKLWGSVTGSPDQELLLISCSNSTAKRGNGGGSNALSCRLAGLDIVHLWDPETCHGYLSISVRCSTIVAMGGRLDWVDTVSSFFSMASEETAQVVDDSFQESDSSPSSGSSFILNLVDVALCYEPHFKRPGLLEGKSESWVGCLLAASSFNLSNTNRAKSVGKNYRIRVQDLGLLLSMVSESNVLGGTYSVQYLRETGYVEVAQEALVEATLRTNHGNGLFWELECSKSHLSIATCSDTTFGLIRLAAQLQQLFAPDLEESASYLQTRWNNIQEAHARNEFSARSGIGISDSSGSELQNSSLDRKKFGVVGLLDEINEDAFNFDEKPTCHIDSLESDNQMPPDESFNGDACKLAFDTLDMISANQFICGSSSEIIPESSQTFFLERDYLPGLIENYCLSDLRPLSELSLGREPSGRQLILEDVDSGQGNFGWYKNDSLTILEDHVSETSGQSSLEHSLDGKLSLFDSESSDHMGHTVGRVLLENINIRWRLYSGFDWHESRKNSESSSINGRDKTVCLELDLSGMQCQYDVFPVGGMYISKFSLSVQDLHLYDRSKAAPWKLVLGYYTSKDQPRESSSKSFKLDLESVRPDPQIPLEEYRLHMALLPMLLHLHQSQLDFLISFFGAETSDKPPVCLDDSGASTSSLQNGDPIAGCNVIEEALLPYFQKFDVWPVTVRVDYCPHHVDVAALREGKYAELVNLVPWKGVELQLKHVHAAGVYGWGNVCETILGEWLEDISQNQIHKLLQGIPTIRSLFALYAGAAKLVSSPVESYRKDRRVVKGVQRGTIAFLRSISLEAVGLGVHLAAGAHDILLRAEYVLTKSPSVSKPQGKAKSNVRHNQPKNAKQGIRQAYESINDGLGKSASALVRTPLKKYQRSGSAGSALAAAIRGVPTAALAPASACAGAVHSTLVGIRNSLDPEHKKESIEKYSGPDASRNQN